MLLYPLCLFAPAVAALMLGHEKALAWAWWLTLIGHLAYHCLRAAAAGVAAVSRERELGTWEALCATRLSPGEIYAAKLRGVLKPLVPGVLFFLALPLAYQALGSVVNESVLPLTLLTIVYTWFCASLGLYASLRCSSSRAAGKLTASWIGALALAPMVAWFGQLVTNTRDGWTNTAAFCPPISYMSVYLKHDHMFRQAGDAWWLSAILYAGLALALTGKGLSLVARPLETRATRRRSLRPLDHVEDAIAYRQACTYSGTDTVLRLGAILAAAAALTWAVKPAHAYVLWALLATAFLCVRAIAAGVGLIAGERERGTLEVLLASPLKPRDILAGKLRAAFRPVLGELAVCCSVTVALGQLALKSPWVIAQNLLVLLASAAFCGALAVRFSSSQSTTLKAAQRSYLGLGFLAFATFWLDVPLNQLFHHNVVFLIWVNPLVAAVAPAENLNVWGGDFLPLTFGILYLVGAGLLLRRSVRQLQ